MLIIIWVYIASYVEMCYWRKRKWLLLSWVRLTVRKGLLMGIQVAEVMEALDIWVRAVRNDDFFCCFWRGTDGVTTVCLWSWNLQNMDHRRDAYILELIHMIFVNLPGLRSTLSSQPLIMIQSAIEFLLMLLLSLSFSDCKLSYMYAMAEVYQCII